MGDNHIIDYPTHGPKRIANELKQQDIAISESGIYNILWRKQLNHHLNLTAYTGVSGRQFRRHPDIKPEHPDTLSIQFLLTLFLINNYHLVHIKLKDLKKFDLKALLFFPIKFCSIIVYP